jgi:transposase
MGVPVGNYLKMADKQRIQVLLELGWSYRGIQFETGVHRDTVARYDPRRALKPTKMTVGCLLKPAGVASVSLSICEPYRDYREDYGFGYNSTSVKRYVHHLKKKRPEVAGVTAHPPGKEVQARTRESTHAQ